jgi:hypothetical protein
VVNKDSQLHSAVVGLSSGKSGLKVNPQCPSQTWAAPTSCEWLRATKTNTPSVLTLGIHSPFKSWGPIFVRCDKSQVVDKTCEIDKINLYVLNFALKFFVGHQPNVEAVQQTNMQRVPCFKGREIWKAVIDSTL